GDLHVLALLEGLDGHGVAHLELARLVAEFAQVAQRRRIGLGEVPPLGLRDALLLHLAEAQLHGFVAVAVEGADRGDVTRGRLDHLTSCLLDRRGVVGLEPDADLVLGEGCHGGSLDARRAGHQRPAPILRASSYSTTSVTTPEPTVRPPSRMAKRRPWSMAIGWISSIVICTLSPGMTISVPSGRFATPVTSVVRK